MIMVVLLLMMTMVVWVVVVMMMVMVCLDRLQVHSLKQYLRTIPMIRDVDKRDVVVGRVRASLTHKATEARATRRYVAIIMILTVVFIGMITCKSYECRRTLYPNQSGAVSLWRL
jgi:hypothetical protein